MVRILLYGNSIFLAGLAEQLAAHAGFDFVTCAALSAVENLADFDVVLLDLDHSHAGEVLTLFHTRPDLRIIGVNAAMSAVTVISGQVYPAHTLGEVIGCLAPVETPQADVSESISKVPADSPASPAADLWG